MALSLDAVKNFGKCEVSIGYNDSATSIALLSGDGAKLPDPATDGQFNLVWYNADDYPDPSDDPNKEIVRCTARNGDTLTITRAQEGTFASTKNSAGKTYKMILTITAKLISDLEGHSHAYSEITGTHGNEDHSATYITSGGVTFEVLNANGDVGTGASQVAIGNHNHSSVYEPANANIQSHIGIINGNPHGVDKSDVGLGNVENTALSTWAGTSNIVTVGDIIVGRTALTSGLVGTDELLVSDAGVIKKMGVSVIQSYLQSNLTFSYSHTHDDRYYTESEITTLLSGYSLTSHNHSGVYIEAITAGSLIDISGTTNVTINVDLSELADMTESILGTDEIVVLDSSVQKRKSLNEIPLSAFNNDSGFITSQSDSQTLSWNGTNGELSISGGNTVDLDGRYLTSETSHADVLVDSDIGINVQAYSSILANTTASFLTAHQTKLGYITVTQAVNLDTMESNIATNNAKVTMTYPGAGIPLSTGSAWGTSITNNSTNWNTAYSHSQVVTGNPHSVSKSDVGLGSVENTALSTWAGSGNITTVGTLVSGNIPWSLISGEPSTYAPSAHTLDSHSNVTVTTIASGEILKWNGTAWINNTLSEAGIQAYSSVLANTTASFTTADETKLDFITVTQAVNLDTMESNIATNNAKVTMTYPSAGIALSTGSAWGTSITNNSANWNTAYGWGNHASAGYYSSGSSPTFGTVTVTSLLKTDELRCNSGNQLVINVGESHGEATGQTSEVLYVNAESGLEINSSPDNWATGWAARNTVIICNSSGNSAFNNIIFNADSTYDIGTNSVRPANVYSDTFIGNLTGNVTGNATTATTANEVNVYSTGDSGTYRVALAGALTGNQSISSDSSLYFDASTNTLTSSIFSGALSGNASTATTLQTARTIAGVSFNGSANISIPYANLTSIPSTFAPSAHTLDSHSNVTITSNSAGEILKWSGSAWINNTLAEAGIASSSHAHTFASLTSVPTTLSGYGITDAVSSTALASWAGTSNVVTVGDIIAGRTELTSGLVSTDELLVSDAGVIKRMDVSVLQSYMQSNLSFQSVGSYITASGVTYENLNTNSDIGNGATQVAIGNHQHKFEFSHSYTVPDAENGDLIGFAVPVMSGTTVKVARVRYWTSAGTCTLAINKNGTGLTGFTSMSASTTAATTDASDQTLSDLDVINCTVSSASSLGDLTVSIIFEITVATYS